MNAFGIHNSTTSHGGLVASTQSLATEEENQFLRAGDGFFCPTCKVWSTLIKSNDFILIDGIPVAFVNDEFTCGAKLMPKQNLVIGEKGSSASTLNASESTHRNFTPASNTNKEKKILDLYWSYGKNYTRIDDISRHRTDLHLHVKTQNYAVGDTVEITLSYDDGSEILDGQNNLIVHGIVNANNEAIIDHIFKDTTIHLK